MFKLSAFSAIFMRLQNDVINRIYYLFFCPVRSIFEMIRNEFRQKISVFINQRSVLNEYITVFFIQI